MKFIFNILQTFKDSSVDRKNHIQLIVDSGFLSELADYLFHYNKRVKTHAAKSINCILSGSDEQMQLLLDGNKISYYSQFLNHQDPIIQNSTIYCLSKVLKHSSKSKEEFINSGLLTEIIAKLSNNDMESKKLSAELISNLTHDASEDIVEKIVSAELISTMCALIQDTKINKVSR